MDFRLYFLVFFLLLCRHAAAFTTNDPDFQPAWNISTFAATDVGSFIDPQDNTTYVVHANFEPDKPCTVHRFEQGDWEHQQDLFVSGAYGLDLIWFNGKLWLAITPFYAGQTYTLETKVFVWATGSKQFLPQQSIQTIGAYSPTFFVMNNTLHVGVAFNRESPTDFDLTSMIYRLNATEYFLPFQAIDTLGASHFEYLEIDGIAYLFLTQEFDGSSTHVDSVLLHFNGTLFVPRQSLPTMGAMRATHFQIGVFHFLAIANRLSFTGGESDFEIDSDLYLWDRNETQFAFFQALPTLGNNGWVYFTQSGEHFLLPANERDNDGYLVDSILYKWIDVETGFVPIDALPAVGVRAWVHTLIGEMALLASAFYTEGVTTSLLSLIYRDENTLPTTSFSPSESDAPTASMTPTLQPDSSSGESGEYDLYIIIGALAAVALICSLLAACRYYRRKAKEEEDEERQALLAAAERGGKTAARRDVEDATDRAAGKLHSATEDFNAAQARLKHEQEQAAIKAAAAQAALTAAARKNQLQADELSRQNRTIQAESERLVTAAAEAAAASAAAAAYAKQVAREAGRSFEEQVSDALGGGKLELQLSLVAPFADQDDDDDAELPMFPAQKLSPILPYDTPSQERRDGEDDGENDGDDVAGESPITTLSSASSGDLSSGEQSDSDGNEDGDEDADEDGDEDDEEDDDASAPDED